MITISNRISLQTFLTAVITRNYPAGWRHNDGLCANATRFLNQCDYDHWCEVVSWRPAYFIQPEWLYDFDPQKYRGYYGWKRRRFCAKLLRELYQ